MAYFAREDTRRKQSPPRRGGKHCGTRDIPSPPKDVLTRDQIVEQNIAAMQRDADGKAGGVLRYVRDTENSHQPARSKHHKPDNDIFGPPVIAPRPTPRIRTGVSDEELRKIWAEDERKAAAQNKMSTAPTMVDRMVAEPVNPIIHSGRSKDHGPPPRKHVELLTGTTQERNRQANEPAGFAGMGRQCAPQNRQGRACKEQEPFVPPELKAAPKYGGRRTKFPADTFSFQEDAQTL